MISIKLAKKVTAEQAKAEIIRVLAGLAATVVSASPLVVNGVDWVDLHIVYTGSLAKIYSTIYKARFSDNTELTADAVTKPIDDFGKQSASYKT